MSQSEDYLDGLLNSITKAKTDAEQVQEDAERKTREVGEVRRISPEEDFLKAAGIDVQETQTRSSHPYLRKAFSEEDFLREFEDELGTDDPDELITAFEQELDDEERLFEETGVIPEALEIVDSLLENIDTAVTDALEKAAIEGDEGDTVEEDGENIADDSPIAVPDEDVDLSEFLEQDSSDAEDSKDSSDEELSLDDAGGEESADDSLKEFMPDDMDALDDLEFGEGEEQDLSGEADLDLDNILTGDEDLLDIQSILNGDDEITEIDESAEEGAEDPGVESSKKGRKKKSKGDKKSGSFISKLALILFGPPDEDDIAEAEAEAAKKAAKEADDAVEISYDEEGNPIVPEGAEPPEDDKKKKKKEKKEKPKKEKKEKPPKPPKPKKEKKPKEPDNSPKIPISIIVTFLVLSISMISVVVVGMTFTGLRRHYAQAKELFAEGDYIGAYEKVNGFSMKDEKVFLLRNQARTLADLQQCQDEYTAFIAHDKYSYALDSLIKGVGRYEKYKDDAQEYGIFEEYNAYYDSFVAQLSEQFGLSVDDALFIYNQPNRHYYTIELRKVLRSLGLPDL